MVSVCLGIEFHLGLECHKYIHGVHYFVTALLPDAIYYFMQCDFLMNGSYTFFRLIILKCRCQYHTLNMVIDDRRNIGHNAFASMNCCFVANVAAVR